MLKIRRMMKKQKGFTLIELIVVIAILGILAAIAIPRFSGMRENSNEGAVIANLRNIQSAAELVATEKNIEIAAVDESDVKEALGTWPKGPGEVSYTFTGGYAEASGTADIPYPDDGVTNFQQIEGVESEGTE